MYDQNAVERAARLSDIRQRARAADPVASAASAPRDSLKGRIVNPAPVSGPATSL